MIHIHYLEPVGHDRWDRPLFRHTVSGQYFCAVDNLDAGLADVAAGCALYFKTNGGKEGEPEFPVTVCSRPVIRCTSTPDNGMFHEGGVYPTFPSRTTASSHDNENLCQVRDDLGHLRTLLYDDLRFIVRNDGFGKVARAIFEIVEDTL